MPKSINVWIPTAVLFVAMSGGFQVAFSQTVSGRITGVITDTSGALVAGANVSARNNATNAASATVSAANGDFQFPAVPAGVYELTVQDKGFKTYIAKSVVVDAQNATTVPVTLQVGSEEASIEVTGTSTHVDTEGASLQTTVGAQTLSSLPVAPPSGSAQRSVINTVQQIQPGASTIDGSSGQYSINGGRGSSNNYKLDGSDVNDYFNANNNENPAFPAAENLGEVSVLTEAIDAKYGNSGGAQITATIKSGTNEFHGIAWGYFQNQAWNANSWTAKHFGLKRAPGSQHWIGGNIGGPVLIPKLYDGRNKTFFFFSYERTNPSTFNTSSSIVPSAAERLGDFSSSEAGSLRSGFSPIVDANGFSPLAKAALANNLIPLPNAPNQFYSWNWSKQQKTENYIVKIDQQLGQRNHLNGSYTRLFQNPSSDNYGSCCGPIPGVLPNQSTILNPHHIYSLYFQDTFVINSSLVNTLSVGGGHTLVSVDKGKQNPNLSTSALNVVGITPDHPATAQDFFVFVQTWATPGFSLFGGYVDSRTADTTSISDDFSWVKGRHTVELGYNQRIHKDTKVGTWDSGGELDYASYNGGSSGNYFYDFFNDNGGIFTQNSAEHSAHSYPQHSFYIQDRFKATQHLTTTVGIRWEPNEGYMEQNNKFSVYRSGRQSTTYPNAPLGMLFYGDHGVQRPGYAPTWTNFNPRIGVAYSLGRKDNMALRGGFAAFSDFTTLQDVADTLGFPYQANYSTGDDPTYYKVTKDPYRGRNPFPYTPPTPGGAAAASYLFPSLQAINSWDPAFNSAHIYQWNVNLQWEPLHSYVFTLGYVGNRSTKLLGQADINTPVFVAGKVTPTNGQSRRPDQNFTSIRQNYSGIGATYNAAQVSLNKRYDNGLSLLANYSFGRTLGECSGGGVNHAGGMNTCRDWRNPTIDYGPLPQDITHVASVVWNYALPIHLGNGFLHYIMGDWTWGGIAHAQSGSPLTLNANNDQNGGSAGAHGNYIGGKKYASFSRTAESITYLNPAAFCDAEVQVVGGVCAASNRLAIGNQPIYGNTGVGFLRGPGSLNFDMTMAKKLQLPEKFGALEFRAGAFNVFNHTQLGNPDVGTSNISNGSSSTFGKITYAGSPRNLQGALRYSF